MLNILLQAMGTMYLLYVRVFWLVYRCYRSRKALLLMPRIEAGAREAYLIEEPMAAAIGAGLPVQEATGSMAVDIGAQPGKVAVISLGALLTAASVRCAAMLPAVLLYVISAKPLLWFISERTAENIKIEIGTAMKVDEPAVMEVRAMVISVHGSA